MRTYSTKLGRYAAEDVPMKDLKVGDLIIQDGVHSDRHGVYAAVYEVTGDCASHPLGWLFVKNLTEDPTARRGDGTLECEGFFSYPPDATMHRVTA